MKRLKEQHPQGDYWWRTRPRSEKELKAIRPYWLQLIFSDGSIQNIKKESSWNSIALFAGVLCSKNADCLDVLFVIDGGIPEYALDFVPTKAIWDRWQPTGFTDCGKKSVDVDVAQFVLANAIATMPR